MRQEGPEGKTSKNEITVLFNPSAPIVFAEIDEADDVQDKVVCRFAQRNRRHADVKRPAYSRGEDCNEADLKGDASHHHHGVATHDAHGGKHFLKITY